MREREKRKKKGNHQDVLDLARIMTPLPDVDSKIVIKTFEKFAGSHFSFLMVAKIKKKVMGLFKRDLLAVSHSEMSKEFPLN